MNGVERRRRWRLEDKLGIVAELDRPGACFAEVARRHDLSRGLLWAWRDQVRRGVLVVEPAPMFVPLQVTAEPLTPMSGADTAPQPLSTSNQPLAPAADGRIEITRKRSLRALGVRRR